MNREVLLVEPNYKNKYPPMGLMKLATYYKRCGDHVTFFKGDLVDLVLNDTFEMLKKQLYANDPTVFWEKYKPALCQYLKKGTKSVLTEIPEIDGNPLIEALVKFYRQFFYRKRYFEPEFRKYDRVGITTLFTFYWNITIETINFAKQLCKTPEGVMVGGIMASILPDRVETETGIRPHQGTLHTPGELDKGNEMVIDTLPLDYSILEEIDYKYPAANAYFAYMTRGCVNKCPFCAVPKLEPEYIEFLPVSEQVHIAEESYGSKQNLLLLDNNVLASCKFDAIVDDIKAAGFYRGATYISPNLYEIAINNLRAGINDKGYIKSCVEQFHYLLDRAPQKDRQFIYDILKDNFLLDEYTARREAILNTYDKLKSWFEPLYSSKPKKRYVDFNQGIDAKLITDSNMQKLAELPIRPVRIAFDHWSLHETYTRAVRIAVSHGHTNLSNYLLYNFDDKPIELYWRLKLNIDLCEELGASIYSFPMKYHPIEDENYFNNRDYIGIYWNRKFIRTIQAILNSTKGKVGRGSAFFYKAFGADDEEYYKLLYMPEPMIIYRFFFEKIGLTDRWWYAFTALSETDMAEAKSIIEKNDFSNIQSQTENPNVLEVLKFYLITREDAEQMMKLK